MQTGICISPCNLTPIFPLYLLYFLLKINRLPIDSFDADCSSDSKLTDAKITVPRLINLCSCPRPLAG